MVDDTQLKTLPYAGATIPRDALMLIVINGIPKKVTFEQLQTVFAGESSGGGIEDIDDLVGVLPEAVTGTNAVEFQVLGQLNVTGISYFGGSVTIDNSLTVGAINVLDTLGVTAGVYAASVEATEYVQAVNHVTANTLRFLNPITELQAGDLPNGSLFANSDDNNTLHFKTADTLYKVDVTAVV